MIGISGKLFGTALVSSKKCWNSVAIYRKSETETEYKKVFQIPTKRLRKRSSNYLEPFYYFDIFCNRVAIGQ